MKKNVFFLVVVAPLALASMASANTRGIGFAAPTVTGKSSVYQPEVGAIVYDESDSTFYGQNHSGSWTPLSGGSSSNVSSNSSGQERIDRASVSSGTNCTTGSCTVNTQSGSWLPTSVTRNSQGIYQLNIASGEFSAAPTCTCTAHANGIGVVMCDGTSASGTSTAITIITSDASGPVDAYFNVICMGPQ